MVKLGETVATGASDVCYDCGKEMPLEVLHSNAGYYIGTLCCLEGAPEAGHVQPNSRESGYYKTRKEAQDDLDSGAFDFR